MKKRRITVKLEEDEAAVVAPLAFWQGLEDHFEHMMKEAPSRYAKGWQEGMHHIRDWVEKTKDTRKLSEEDE